MDDDAKYWLKFGVSVAVGVGLVVYLACKSIHDDRKRIETLQQQTVSYYLPKECDTVLNTTRHIDHYSHSTALRYSGATLTYRTKDGRVICTTYMFHDDFGQDIEWKPRPETIDSKVEE